MKKFFVVFVAAFMLLSTSAMAFTMTEVPAEDIFTPELIEKEKVSDWAADEIELARQSGLLTEHTSDYMTKTITRFQFAELAANFAEKATGKPLSAASDTTFTDTKEQAVLKSYQAGIVQGVGDGKFDPDASLTREQLATMLWRAISYVQTETGKTAVTSGGSLSGYTDASKVSGWAKDAVAALAQNGIMKGTSGTTLSPAESCTVEQSVLLVYRTFQKL